MKIALSFSMPFRDVPEGEAKIKDFDALFFGCSRENFFDPILLVDDKLMEEVRKLDAQGRVHFRMQAVLGIPNQLDFAALLHKQGHEVWLNGEWYKSENESDKEKETKAIERANALAEGSYAEAYADFFEQYGTP